MKPVLSDNIIAFLQENPASSSGQVHVGIASSKSYATIKRTLSDLVSKGLVELSGRGKGSKYTISPTYAILRPIVITDYFAKEVDERKIKQHFQESLLIDILPRIDLFSAEETSRLNQLHERFKKNTASLDTLSYNKEMERLAIDLSWKSSQIEGNTYTLLETELLLREKEKATGKPESDAIMLLNHKQSLEFIIEHPNYLVPLSVSRIEDIHSILIKDLDVNRNLRQSRVGISGTNYKPLDNEFQIREALSSMCTLVNQKGSPYEKALLTLLLLSYIQPFVDGNKRTARIISNALLIAAGYCPLSFRTVDPLDYKMALLVFYEQNNISAFKKIFIEQATFAIDTYF